MHWLMDGGGHGGQEEGREDVSGSITVNQRLNGDERARVVLKTFPCWHVIAKDVVDYAPLRILAEADKKIKSPQRHTRGDLMLRWTDRPYNSWPSLNLHNICI